MMDIPAAEPLGGAEGRSISGRTSPTIAPARVPVATTADGTPPAPRYFRMPEQQIIQQNEELRKAEVVQLDPIPPTNTCASTTPIVTPEAAAGTAEQRHADDLLAMWIASSLRPASIVEDPGFINYVNYVNGAPQALSVPAREMVVAHIRSKAAELRASLKLRLATECDYFSASSDIWTSRSAESFLSVTLHYLDADYNLNGWTLEVERLPDKHDAASIGAALASCFDRWDLSRDKCTRFLRDGGSGIKQACDDLCLRHFSCVAHSLHLVVGAGFMWKNGDAADADVSNNLGAQREDHTGEADSEDDDIGLDDPASPDLIDTLSEEVATLVASSMVLHPHLEHARLVVARFRKLAVYFHRSPKGFNRLKAFQKDSDTPLKTCVDSPTRWRSTMVMLRRLLRLRPALDAFFAFLRDRPEAHEFDDVRRKLARPTSEDWFIVQCLVKLLEPFRVATGHLSGARYPTLVALFPVIRSLRDEISEPNLFDELHATVSAEPFALGALSMMESVRRSFIVLLDERFAGMHAELKWALLLDPRFVNTQLLSTDEMEQASSCFISAMVLIAKAAAVDSNHPNASTPRGRGEPAAKRAKLSFERRLFGSRMNMRAQGHPADDDGQITEQCKWEYNQYVREASLVEANCSPLQWWKDNHTHFRTIAPLARKWLGCIATSVPSERAFSTTGNIVAKRRSALKVAVARDMLFLSENPSA
ncbi:hypothetical protein BBJ28_00000074 [Nothophytophthora sp. Chile5]|nr:hypothetical protein BBJ28_00000074 [Nothophytophthora sp. Chile5]